MIKSKAIYTVLFLLQAICFGLVILTKTVIYDEVETTSFHSLKDLDEAFNEILFSPIYENNRLT
jgi:hypothetical protein